ncbi:adenylate kinase [Halobacteriales archaeon QS_4_62_28]|nr:MAG: adenylate kinase [Halobacteriales archaeon QS_4_62_28]
MRVAVTGTPGTGKTTVTEHLDTDLDVIHLNEYIKAGGLDAGIDEDRNSVVADFDAVADFLDGRTDVLFESHLAHNVAADRVVVLRAHPETIVDRLTERGESAASVQENAESEALDIILSEAVERHGTANVYEIDTTDRTVEAVADDVAAAVTGEREPSAGTVSFIDYL